MATPKNTVKIKDIQQTESAYKRAFSRVDTVKATPTIIYDGFGIAEADRAVFTIKPADPVTADEVRTIGMTMNVLFNEVLRLCELNIEDVREATEDNAWKITNFYNRLRMARLAHISSVESREILARCVVGVTNYKELTLVDGVEEVVASEKSVAEIVESLPAVFIEWIFEQVQDLSNLTNAEILGV